MQCEIIQQHMLSAFPQDEETRVVNNDHPDPPNPPFDPAQRSDRRKFFPKGIASVVETERRYQTWTPATECSKTWTAGSSLPRGSYQVTEGT